MFIKIKQRWVPHRAGEGAIYSAPWNSSLSAPHEEPANFLGRRVGGGSAQATRHAPVQV